MKPKKFRKEHAVEKGWSRWVHPLMRGYLMACCDCGLVHELQFQALRQTSKPNARGNWKCEKVTNGRIALRARRAPLHTKRLRAADKFSHKEVV